LNPRWKEELLRIADTNGDRQVSMSEFQAALQSIGVFLTTYMYGRALALGEHRGQGVLQNLRPRFQNDASRSDAAVEKWRYLYLRLKKTHRYITSGSIPLAAFGELLEQKLDDLLQCQRSRSIPLALCLAPAPANARALALPNLHPGLGSHLPHLNRDWAHPCHICTRCTATPAQVRLF
jgi:hypothetical protein